MVINVITFFALTTTQFRKFSLQQGIFFVKLVIQFDVALLDLKVKRFLLILRISLLICFIRAKKGAEILPFELSQKQTLQNRRGHQVI